jgi:putative tricarboxylic transport membrane protein
MVLGLFMVYEAGNMHAGFGSSLGPGVFPRFLGLGIAGLSAIMFLMEFFPQLMSKEKIAWPEGAMRIKVLATVGAIIAYLAALEWLGFALCTFCLVVTLVKVLGQSRWWVNLAAAVVTTTICVMVFQVWLDLKLPGGFIGI